MYSSTQVDSTLVYRAVDGITGLPSSENASISIVVTHVNQPPRPPLTMNYTTRASGRLRVDMLGADVDSSIVYGTVQLLPGRGSLEDGMNVSLGFLSPMQVGTDAQGHRYVFYTYTGMTPMCGYKC